MSDGKVRVLCVGRDLKGGGAERVQLMLLGHLSRRRLDIRLFYLKNEGVLHELIPSDIAPIYAVAGNESVKRKSLQVFARLVRLARDSDVIFAMQDATPIYLSILAGRLTRRPVVGWIHNTWSAKLQHVPPWHRWASSLFYPFGDQFIGVSEGVVSDMVRFAPRLRARIVARPNPIVVRYLRTQAEAPLPEWAEQIFAKRTLLAAGRLVPAKGFDILLRALSHLLEQGLDLNLLILGEGEERPKLEALAKRLGVSGRLFMPGFQKNPYPFFRRAHIFVLSSRYEGLGMVILEALALGLPIVSTDCPFGPREMLGDGSYGVLVPPGNATALGEAVRALTSAADERARLSAAGIARAEEYDVSRVTALFEDVLIDCARGAERR